MNNFYPNNGAQDSMCLPWTWFMAVYMQLSMILPFVLYLIMRLPIFATSIHVFLCFSCLIVQGILIAVNDTGINPITDPAYFSSIYIKPWS
jgi:peptidoglycan/LPS O-acetylase OafA/YrhL